MDEKLWTEKTCSSLIPDLPLWIIEFAWSERMIDVLEDLGPPLWLEGNWSCLKLEDSCIIRVVAAEAWMVIRARDVKHFERVMEFLEVTHLLLPRIVSSIKHMKIIFGLKTLVIMWMLWADKCVDSITDKIIKFFPDSLSQYRRSSLKHMELMLKTQQDFRSFALSLTRNPDMRKTYIRDLMEEQYGECYALKLEERLLHYLEQLDKALKPTRIDQVLKHSWKLGEREQLIHQLLTCKTTSKSTALKTLLRCALANHSICGDADQYRLVFGPFSLILRLSQERREDDDLLHTCTQGSRLYQEKRPYHVQKGSEIDWDGQGMLKQKPDICQTEPDLCVLQKKHLQRKEPGLASGQREAKEVITDNLCSRHSKIMKNIFQECSEEPKVQEQEFSLAHSESTPSSHSPILHSTPQSLIDSSASPLQDSSSTNISLSSHPESISAEPSPPLLLQQNSLSLVSFVQTSSSPTDSPSESSSPGLSLQTPLLHLSKSVASSSFTENKISVPLASTIQGISSSPRASPSVQQQSSSPVFSVQQISSPASLSHQSCSLLNPLSSRSPTPDLNSVPCPETTQDLDIITESRSISRGNLKLSLETQGLLLMSNWLQPHVLLQRLTQQECDITDQQSEEEEVEETESFDVNWLYSDSESDTQDSDDSDYIPSKHR
ncbi:uncharacterized protein [Hoplias malabaricus]|uniref:uncharacterized protein n=1 Tax=Hoplias malabaricus TaxID=27720 RepID=UPI0034631775